MTVQLISAAVLFLFTLVTGMVVSRSGKPLNVGLVTVHKLLAVAVIALIGLAVYPAVRDMGAAALQMAAVVVCGALFLALITSGALLTREEMQLPPAVLKLHQVSSVLSVLVSPLMLLLLLNGKA